MGAPGSMGLLTKFKRSPLIYLLLLLPMVNQSYQSDIKNNLQKIENLIVAKFTDMDNKLANMDARLGHMEDTFVNYMKVKIDNIETEVEALGLRSSQSLTSVENAVKGPINEIKSQGNVILEEINLIKHQVNHGIESVKDQEKSLFNTAINNQTLSSNEIITKLDTIENQLNQGLNTLKDQERTLFDAAINNSMKLDSLKHPVNEIKTQGNHILTDLNVIKEDLSSQGTVILENLTVIKQDLSSSNSTLNTLSSRGNETYTEIVNKIIGLDDAINNLTSSSSIEIKSQGTGILEKMNVIKQDLSSSNYNWNNLSSRSNEIYTDIGNKLVGLDETIKKSVKMLNQIVEEQQDKKAIGSSLIIPSSSTPKMTWLDSWSRCQNMGAQPFVPKTRHDFEVITTVNAGLGCCLWLPASDIVEEGVLKWWDGQDAAGSQGLVWEQQELLYNSENHDCVRYGSDLEGVHMSDCSNNFYPMICTKMNK